MVKRFLGILFSIAAYLTVSSAIAADSIFTPPTPPIAPSRPVVLSPQSFDTQVNALTPKITPKPAPTPTTPTNDPIIAPTPSAAETPPTPPPPNLFPSFKSSAVPLRPKSTWDPITRTRKKPRKKTTTPSNTSVTGGWKIY
jgi:hypothetical protein